MIPGLNNVTDEILLGLVARDGVVSEESVDPNLGGQNEQFDVPLPYDGYIQYLIVHKNPFPEFQGKQPYVEMRTIFVDKTKRRNGAGAMLFKALEKIAEREGISRLVIKVQCAEKDDPNPFCAFMPAMGYKRCLPENPYDFDWEKYV
mgnify:FL=1